MERLSPESKTPAEGKPLTCHFLPCSVDFSGHVPGADHFFQPTAINPETEHEKSLAATFRGRGIMGRETKVSVLDCPAHLRILKVGSGNADDILAVEGPSIQHAIEWQHQHVPDAAKNTKGRMKYARAWLQVAHTLHTPLPPPETF